MNTAVVGLGAMGRRIARRLLDGGHAVAVWNRSPERARELVDAGATPATTPADAARRSELVIVMVADPAALAAVTESPQGICAGVGDGTIVVNTSTVGPAAVRRLAGLLPPGVALLDAPVLGSLSEVESGTLTIFVGGDERDLERAAPALDVLGATIHVGGIGAGSAAKLVANSTLFGVLGVVGEALAAADALGLSREKTFAVLAATPVAAQAERRRASIEGDDYPTRFALSLAHKDADLLAAAVEAGDLRLFEAARSWLADADAAGRGEQDYASMLEQILSENERASSSG
jgi:3-hydroxyisobutyrate dehydrogenase-like beta-hydroxyacid dehydrogenase